jgi:hypothetical protein
MDILGRVLVAHRRAARDHSKLLRIQTAQLRNELLGQPLAEVVLLVITAQIAQREYREQRTQRAGVGRGFAGRTGMTLFPPGVKLRRVGVDARKLAVVFAMDREVLVPLPALHRAHVALEIRGDRLPGIQALPGLLGVGIISGHV